MKVISGTPNDAQPVFDTIVRNAGRVCDAVGAGLQLDDLMLAQLLEGAPYALDMVRRLRRDHDVHHPLRETT